jgi:hypothetical protein
MPSDWAALKVAYAPFFELKLCTDSLSINEAITKD